MLVKLEGLPNVIGPVYTESWLRGFLTYAHEKQDDLNITTETQFIQQLKHVS